MKILCVFLYKITVFIFRIENIKFLYSFENTFMILIYFDYFSETVDTLLILVTSLMDGSEVVGEPTCDLIDLNS